MAGAAAAAMVWGGFTLSVLRRASGSKRTIPVESITLLLDAALTRVGSASAVDTENPQMS